ncbi:MAG: rod shape-determining protein RodA [Lentisphaeria bacterium]|nr:rod shape-determining protein RodA [Lentisphaeria bacterium]MBR3506961.1 rod shape-determining protein RodA [Lentisphaeria bacterium]
MAEKKKRQKFSKTVVKQQEGEETNAQILRGVIARFFARFDLMQIIPLALLLTIGMCFVHSTGQQVGGHHVELFSRQCVYLAVGLALWFTFIMLDYRLIGLFSMLFYPAVIAVLVLVLIFGPVRNNTRRWIDIGPVSLQPSELGKMAVLFIVAWVASFTKNNINKLRWLGLVLALTAIPFLLICREPDLGTAIVLIPLTAAILFAANLRWLYIIIFAALCIGGPLVAYNSPILKPYQKKRIAMFLNPESERFGGGWNVIQAEIAVGTGGMTGKGYRNGTHTMLGYLPPKVADSDFIFPVIAEETGFAGTFSLILLYALLLFSILRSALFAHDLFGRYLCVGIAAILMTHVFINIGMCIRLVPVTGLPLPFISYGGTFLVAMLCYLGIAQSVYAHRNDPSSVDTDNWPTLF